MYGSKNLSINKISKDIGLALASFYHHFGDIDMFIDELLDMHWQSSKHFSSAGVGSCKKLFPDLYKLLEQFTIGIK